MRGSEKGSLIFLKSFRKFFDDFTYGAICITKTKGKGRGPFTCLGFLMGRAGETEVWNAQKGKKSNRVKKAAGRLIRGIV